MSQVMKNQDIYAITKILSSNPEHSMLVDMLLFETDNNKKMILINKLKNIDILKNNETWISVLTQYISSKKI